MKKIPAFLIVAILLIACKKIEKEPYGPTDIRIINITTSTMHEVTVNTWDSTFNYGSIEPDDTTLYHRFNRAYPEANISAIIDGVLHKTDTTTYYGGTYLGQMKASYKLWVVSAGKLGMSVWPESPLK